MFSVSIRDHIMIAHSLRGEIFGPAQRVHGATYVVEVEFRRPELDRHGIVVDIGAATSVLRGILSELNYRNLDDDPEFAGVNTTTEVLARVILDRVRGAIRTGALGEESHAIYSLKVTLHESPNAAASYEEQIETDQEPR